MQFGDDKTTLLNYVLNDHENIRVTVIVNDMSEINVDASLVPNGGTSYLEQKQKWSR